MHAVYQTKLQLKRREMWASLVNAWKASSLSAKEFCIREQIHLSDLRRWQYRLRKAVVSPEDIEVCAEVKKAVPAMQFVPINLLGNESLERAYFDLMVGHCRLRIYSNFSEPLLLQLMGVLKKVSPC